MRNLFLLLTALSSPAVGLEISYGMGEHTSDNRLQACVIAENKALKNALVNYSQRQFQFTNQSYCRDTADNSYCSYIKEIDASTSGTIRSVVDRIKRRKDDTCFMEVKAEIEPAVQLPVNVKAQQIYIEGDEIEIDVDTRQPLYLYMFNLHNNGIEVLFPRTYREDTLIDDRFKYPGDEFQVVASTGGQEQSEETLVFLFTKQRQNIDIKFIETGGNESLKELLQSIPVNEKRLIVKNVIIRSK